MGKKSGNLYKDKRDFLSVFHRAVLKGLAFISFHRLFSFSSHELHMLFHSARCVRVTQDVTQRFLILSFILLIYAFRNTIIAQSLILTRRW